MANGTKFLGLINGIKTLLTGIQTGTGSAGDAGKIVGLNSAGYLDSTLLATAPEPPFSVSSGVLAFLANVSNGGSVGSLVLTASRQYFWPVTVPAPTVITNVFINGITTAATGTFSIGIYANSATSGDLPTGAPLASYTAGSSGATGNTVGGGLNSPLTLQPGVKYWASMICSAAATVRSWPGSSMQPVGIQAGGSMVNAYYLNGSGSTLATSASTTGGATTVPVITFS